MIHKFILDIDAYLLPNRGRSLGFRDLGRVFLDSGKELKMTSDNRISKLKDWHVTMTLVIDALTPNLST